MILYRFAFIFILITSGITLSAQDFKSERLRKVTEMLEVQVPLDSVLPQKTFLAKAKDGKAISFRTDSNGVIEHIGFPLFNQVIRMLQPSPVYDFLEFALLNKVYKVDANLLYLSKVIFKLGSWGTLLNERLRNCECSIANQDNKLYIVTWRTEDKDIAIIGIPIEYELLNNDTRRNMERTFIKEVSTSHIGIPRAEPTTVNEEDLSIYGTEGLFVIPGQSYIIDLLNQNVYYKLTTVNETVDTVIYNKPVTMNIEAVLPVIVNDTEFPVETFANLIMCDNNSVPDPVLNLDFHLSNYQREQVSMPLSQLKAYCQQQNCKLYFACVGIMDNKIRGILIANNLSKGYNHLFSLHTNVNQLTSSTPEVHADVYLYIPPIDKEKLFGIVPTKKSGTNIILP